MSLDVLLVVWFRHVDGWLSGDSVVCHLAICRFPCFCFSVVRCFGCYWFAGFVVCLFDGLVISAVWWLFGLVVWWF